MNSLNEYVMFNRTFKQLRFVTAGKLSDNCNL